MLKLPEFCVKFDGTFSIEEHQKIVSALRLVRDQYLSSAILDKNQKKHWLDYYDRLIQKVESAKVFRDG